MTEQFRGDAGREDKTLYDTMKAIRDRLNFSLVVAHPVTPNQTITKGPDDPKARFLRDRLTEAVDNLAPLFEANCTRKTAVKCWDKVFSTTFFSDRLEKTAEATVKVVAAPTILTTGLLSDAAAAARTAVRKEGGGRYA